MKPVIIDVDGVVDVLRMLSEYALSVPYFIGCGAPSDRIITFIF